MNEVFSLRFSRRRLVCGLAAQAALPSGSAGAAPAVSGPRPSIAVAQFADMSPEQQDVSRDFLAGSRAAWQDINLHGGLQGRPVQHITLELDGSAAAVRAAWRGVQANAACVALTGTTGHAMATDLAALLRQDGASPIAHVAPWLQDNGSETDARTFPVFAGRQEQIAHAIRSLSVVGISEIGAVYASARDHSQYRADVERTASSMKLGLRSVRLDAGPAPAAASLPAIVLFIGGTPELLAFCQTLDRRGSARQQFIVALADVNLQTLAQAGIPRNTPVIATQPVPIVTASLPIVRSYRETMSRLFDEAPTPQSLAGFIAARYTFAVLNSLDAPPTRANVLAAFQRRDDVDVGGYRVSYNAQRRGSVYVTQSMLAADGRLVG